MSPRPHNARPLKTCACGHTKGHELVVEEPEYTLWGWILLSMFGVTPKPDHIVYRCQMCRKSVGVTRDPRILARRSGDVVPSAPMNAVKESIDGESVDP